MNITELHSQQILSHELRSLHVKPWWGGQRGCGWSAGSVWSMLSYDWGWRGQSVCQSLRRRRWSYEWVQGWGCFCPCPLWSANPGSLAIKGRAPERRKEGGNCLLYDFKHINQRCSKTAQNISIRSLDEQRLKQLRCGLKRYFNILVVYAGLFISRDIKTY